MQIDNNPNIQILVIHTPGRKRDNLAVLLVSLFPTREILATADPRQGLELLRADRRVIIFLDHSSLKEELLSCLMEMRRRNSRARVVLMLSHPQSNHPYPEFEADGILYDGFSPHRLVEMLTQLSGSDITGRSIGQGGSG